MSSSSSPCVLAERAVLACLLVDPFLWPLQALLRLSDFSSPYRAAVLDAMRRVTAEKRPIDAVTVLEELARSGIAAPAGVPGWATPLGELLDDVLRGACWPEEECLKEYVRVVREAAADRRATARANGVARVA